VGSGAAFLGGGMGFDWKATVKAVAPLLGTAIGGPIGGVATQVLTSVLGIPEDSPEEKIELAVQNATPAQLVDLKKADQAFRVTMRELGIKEDQLHAADRESARKMNIALGGDMTLKGIAVFTVFAFFAMIGFLLWAGAPTSLDKTILGLLIGYAAGKAEQVYNFFFGSSKGSQDKTEHLAKRI
jgi:hypothetical protein